MSAPTFSAIGLVVAMATNAMAFPSAPLPMYELWQRSDIVVFADVISANSENGKQHAIISIAKVLKGDQSKTSTSIPIFTHLGGCPYPHYFKATERVIVFLHYDSDERMYTTVGAAEAAIKTDADSLQEYQSRFDELPIIFAEADEGKRNNQLLRWSVKCTINPSTRSEGLMSLQWIRPRNAKVGDWLLPAEANELLEIIFQEPCPDSVLGLIGLMGGFPSKQLDDLLVTSLSNCDKEGWSSTARHALQSLPIKLNIKLPAALDQQLDEYWELESNYFYGDLKRNKKSKESLKASLNTKFGWVCAQVWIELTSENAFRAQR